MTTALEARDLVKEYPGVLAVDGVSFDVAEGICFGLLGPNGAGKTTTVEIIEGVTPATSGDVYYYGEPAGARFRQETGIQFQNTALQDYLTVRETLDRNVAMRSTPAARLLKRAATPLTVELVSDNLTDVSIYKVGKLGAFATTQLS